MHSQIKIFEPLFLPTQYSKNSSPKPWFQLLQLVLYHGTEHHLL